MTQIHMTICDACGEEIKSDAVAEGDDRQPMWILCGRINNSLRLDICFPCFESYAPYDLLAMARKRGVDLGE